MAQKTNFIKSSFAFLMTGWLATTAAAELRDCERAFALADGQSVVAEVVALDVSVPSIVRLDWDADARAERLICGEALHGLVLERTDRHLVVALDRAGVHTIRLRAAGGGSGSPVPQVRATHFAVGVRRDVFEVEIDGRRLEIEQTTFHRLQHPTAQYQTAQYQTAKYQVVTDPDPLTIRSPTAPVASHFVLRDVAPAIQPRWLGAFAISSWSTPQARRLAAAVGSPPADVLTAWIETGGDLGAHRHKYQVVTDPDPHKYQVVTDPDPHKYQVVTDPDPHKYQVVTDPDPHKYQVVTDPDPYKYQVVTDPDPLTAPGRLAWRAELALEGAGGPTGHIDALAWLAPMVVPGLDRRPSAAHVARLLSWSLAD